MSNENFGLGFTISQPAFFNDNAENGGGNFTGSSSIFADISTLKNMTGSSSIFADITLLDNMSGSTALNAFGICARPSVLSADQNPANVSTLGSPGQNTMGC